ncbi:MAG: (Fe-S)-binding protein [Syntrophobacteraceae bacterium]|jgi:uncharacterized Fe-S cluster-containing protein
MDAEMRIFKEADLPGLNCGICGFRTCGDFAAQLPQDPTLIRRCIHLSEDRIGAIPDQTADTAKCFKACADYCVQEKVPSDHTGAPQSPWLDTLGREFDFFLEHFPEDPGPREIILPHNPILTREMDIREGDVLIGRPLGMSCGCPITHCGEVMQVDQRTGVIVWCVTGPLRPRQEGFKDIGYYIAEGYEGMIKQTRATIRIGERYYFQPRMCMLQWRHSGLVNYINKTQTGLQVRLEGLWIG